MQNYGPAIGMASNQIYQLECLLIQMIMFFLQGIILRENSCVSDLQ